VRQNGVVMSTEGTHAVVKVVQHGACGTCRQKCGLAEKAREHEVLAINAIAAKKDDAVEIELPDNELLKAALWVYVWPLLFLFLGVMLGLQVWRSEAYALLLGLLGLAVSIIVVKFILEPKARRSNRYIPTIVGHGETKECKER